MTEETFTYDEDLGVVEGRENLWRAVLAQTIAEASGRVVSPNSPSHRASVIRKARDYITIPNDDFDTVCSLAGLDPEAVREGVARQLTNPSTPAPQEAPKPRQIQKHTFNGESLTVGEWSKRTGLSTHTIRSRLRLGWSIEQTLTRPKQGGTITLAGEVAP